MDQSEVKFIVDTMLGRLAKWLRVMGFDTHYQPFYEEKTTRHLIKEGFLFLSRQKTMVESHTNSFLILSDKVKGQLQEMKKKGYIPPARSNWFTRCLVCNEILKKVTIKDAGENIPEYILYQNKEGISMCPSCKRYFWPGSHKNRMINQLKVWGIQDD